MSLSSYNSDYSRYSSPIVEQQQPFQKMVQNTMNNNNNVNTPRRITRSYNKQQQQQQQQPPSDVLKPIDLVVLDNNLKDVESNLCKLMENTDRESAALVNGIYKYTISNLMTNNNHQINEDCVNYMMMENKENQRCQQSTTPRITNTNGGSNNSKNFYFNSKKSVKMTVPSNKRQILEEEFRKEKYPSNEKLQKLSTKLNMRYDEVQNYFKKRRKEEKETNHKFSNLVKLLNNYLEQED